MEVPKTPHKKNIRDWCSSYWMIAIDGWRYRICLDLDGVATDYAFGDVGIQAGRPSFVPEERFEAKCSGRCTWLQWRCQEACCSCYGELNSKKSNSLFLPFHHFSRSFRENSQALFLLPRDRPRLFILLERDWKWCNWCPLMSPLLLISGDYHDLCDRLLHKHHGQILSMLPFLNSGFYSTWSRTCAWNKIRHILLAPATAQWRMGTSWQMELLT